MNTHQIIYNAAKKVLEPQYFSKKIARERSLLIADIACLRLADAQRRKLKAAKVRWMPEGRK